MVMMRPLGQRIAALREGAGWSQEKLAEEVELSVNFISQMERGQRAPSFPTLEKLAGVFKLEVKDFFDFNDPPDEGIEEMCKELREFCLYLRTRDIEEVRKIRKIARIVLEEPKKPRKGS